ncbi:MAG: hypothetical protein WBQ71_16085 [Trebonia sp.]
MFASRTGTELDGANVRRAFRKVTAAAGLNPTDWTPRELRHSFVSLLSAAGVPPPRRPFTAIRSGQLSRAALRSWTGTSRAASGACPAVRSRSQTSSRRRSGTTRRAGAGTRGCSLTRTAGSSTATSSVARRGRLP